MRKVLLAGVLAALGTLSGDRDPAPAPAMMQADRAFVQAVAKADKPALEKLLDADFTWTDFEGKTQTKDRSCTIRPRALSQTRTLQS